MSSVLCRLRWVTAAVWVWSWYTMFLEIVRWNARDACAALQRDADPGHRTNGEAGSSSQGAIRVLLRGPSALCVRRPGRSRAPTHAVTGCLSDPCLLRSISGHVVVTLQAEGSPATSGRSGRVIERALFAQEVRPAT